MAEQVRYPLWRKESIPAYVTIMAIWIGFSLVSAGVLSLMLAPALSWPAARDTATR